VWSQEYLIQLPNGPLALPDQIFYELLRIAG
jgi:hypothetical protein